MSEFDSHDSFWPQKTKESADGVDNNGSALNETVPGILPGAESKQSSIATPFASQANGTQGTSNEDKPISFKQQLNEGKLYLTQKKIVEFASHLEHRFSNFRSLASGAAHQEGFRDGQDSSKDVEAWISAELKDLWLKERLLAPAKLRDAIPMEPSQSFCDTHYDKAKATVTKKESKDLIQRKLQEILWVRIEECTFIRSRSPSK